MYNTTKSYIKQIQEEIVSTWDTPYVKITDIGGSYPVITRRINKYDIDHTDGIGTKGFYHWRKRSFAHAVQDALAMNLNDLITMGAVPYKLQDHLILQEDDHFAIIDIVKELAKECRRRNIAIGGGETSIQWNLGGMELSLCVTGFITDLCKRHVVTGDWLIGLRSSGLHANGLTRAADIISDLDVLTKPTIIYLDTVRSILDKYTVNSMVHIAGGAFTRLKSILTTQNAEINVGKDIPQVFFNLFKGQITDTEMYKTFNCGIGFVMSLPQEHAENVLKDYPKEAVHIGHVQAGDGLVRIKSSFSDTHVIF